ncbi:aminoacetone oxidase family FAD-binding enzyme [Azospirillum argentinense]|uniref:Aminoacetone oxidase family FAD-binding enzyme n=1 Tax=Azospirillum argentinense TaxID=2970906 RepID=A0A2K1G0N1_9PROT|nr:TIGR03862 family flavoprotein [Azospirillum argentinense]PNQ98325.1 aminoacetone oxidase family FAD-binding enzyme [Azospirillum argentinense]
MTDAPETVSFPDVAIVGAGPAGLMAAEVIAAAGRSVAVYERMPTPARKLLLAGRGGLNLTHSEALDAFTARYGAQAPLFADLLASFSPADLRDWATGLGIETFVGSSGRVFPVQMKASTLVRAWLRRLEGLGVTLHTRHRWLGWDASGALHFQRGDGTETTVAPRATLLALGGASWPRTGSDGAWTELLAARGVDIAPLRPSNMGFEVPWSDHLRERFAGQPVKSVGLAFGDRRLKGEFVITETGIEGGAVYALSAPLRDAIEREGWAALTIDLMPDLPESAIAKRLRRRGAESLSTFLKKSLSLTGPRAALLREFTPASELSDPAALARHIKGLSMVLTGLRPIERAISTAGGVRLGELDNSLMLTRLPGTFIAGEMLDWEAPTGGYLLQGCFAMGTRAGKGVLGYLGG